MKLNRFVSVGAVIGGGVGLIGPFIIAATAKNAGLSPIVVPVTVPLCALAGAIIGVIVGGIVMAFRKSDLPR